MAKILLVDDQRLFRDVHTDILTSAGHEVIAVASTAEARSALATGLVELMVTDLVLPESDGINLLQTTRAEHPDVPVVLMTGVDRVEPALRALKGGAADYLVKPVLPEAMLHAVARALQERGLQRENADLRAHLALMDAAKRLATTLDRETMLEAATHAFTVHCRAHGVAIFAQRGTHLYLERIAGVEPLEFDAVSRTVFPAMTELGKAGARVQQVLKLEGTRFRIAHVFFGPRESLAEPQTGAVVLLFTDVPERWHVETATFLVNHLAVGFANLRKFSRVEDMAHVDDLTHLSNRRYLEQVLDRQVMQAVKSGGSFSMLFIDLDNFKRVNDTWGHLTGSMLLIEVARVLKRCARGNDTVARFGGDEYVVLLSGTDSAGALPVAERIRLAIERHVHMGRDGSHVRITASIGVASFPEDALDRAELLEAADRAMYRAKQLARNAVVAASRD